MREAASPPFAPSGDAPRRTLGRCARGRKPQARRGETPDQDGYFVSESSVFRLLKRFDLVEGPASHVVTTWTKVS